jgi:hypothetical protein
VNGGQTTATLAGAMTDKDNGLGQTFSVLPAETSGKYIPLIARYANSQNRMSDADFFSNHEFHRRMEQIAKALRAPAERAPPRCLSSNRRERKARENL